MKSWLVRLIRSLLVVLPFVGCSSSDRAESDKLRAELESAKEENSRLKDELSRLRAELENVQKPAPAEHKVPSETGAVAGTVLYKGQPLPGGIVTIVHPDGRVAQGLIQEDGTYSIPESPVGDVKVTVMTVKPIPPLPSFARPPEGQGKGGGKAEPVYPAGKYVPIPKKYSQPDTSGLGLTVKPGNQRFDIHLAD